MAIVKTVSTGLVGLALGLASAAGLSRAEELPGCVASTKCAADADNACHPHTMAGQTQISYYTHCKANTEGIRDWECGLAKGIASTNNCGLLLSGPTATDCKSQAALDPNDPKKQVTCAGKSYDTGACNDAP